MLGSSKMMAFVGTTQAAEALAFYRDVLGLTLVADEEFAVVFDAHGTTLRIQKTPAFTPQPFTAAGWEVKSMEQVVKGLVKRGVVFERYGFLTQDVLGIWTSPGGARVAWFKDPDGNVLSLTQM